MTFLFTCSLLFVLCTDPFSSFPKVFLVVLCIFNPILTYSTHIIINGTMKNVNVLISHKYFGPFNMPQKADSCKLKYYPRQFLMANLHEKTTTHCNWVANKFSQYSCKIGFPTYISMARMWRRSESKITNRKRLSSSSCVLKERQLNLGGDAGTVISHCSARLQWKF